MENRTIKKGETLKADLGLGAYTTMAEFTIMVNEQPLPVDKGKAVYEFVPKSVGEHTYEVKVVFKNPLTGQVDQLTKEYKYKVTE